MEERKKEGRKKKTKGRREKKREGRRGGREGERGEKREEKRKKIGRKEKEKMDTIYVIQSNDSFVCFFGNAISPSEERIMLQLS